MLPSYDRQRRHPGAGGPAQFGVGNDEQEFAEAVARGVGQPEVLHDHHAVADVEQLRDGERRVGALRRIGAETPGVAPGQRHPVIGEPPGQRQAGTWLARGVLLVVGTPQAAVAGVEEHRVAGADVVPGGGQGRFRVGHGDQLAGRQPVPAACRRHVQQQAAGHHLGKGVDAQPVRTVVRDDVGEAEPVIGPVAGLQVVEPVHVGAHLLGGRDLLDDPLDAVEAESGRARVGATPVDVVIVGGQVLPERPAGKRRDVLVQHVRQVINQAPADQPDGFQHLARRDLVQRARLVPGAVPRRPPAGHRVLEGRGLCSQCHVGYVPSPRGTFHRSSKRRREHPER